MIKTRNALRVHENIRRH